MASSCSTSACPAGTSWIDRRWRVLTERHRDWHTLHMAPEQALGDPIDAHGSLRGGAILFEMVAGRPAFSGATLVDVLHATVHEQPPALSGSPAIAAADRADSAALAKRPADRFATANDLANALRELPSGEGDDRCRRPRADADRRAALPRAAADPETDFLAFSLPDAIATSLSW